MTIHRIALIPGDGIGAEVLPAGRRVLEAVGARHGIDWDFEGVPSPLRDAHPGSVDLVVVRENVEGEYSEIGGRLNRGFPDEMAVQETVFTRAGITRVARTTPSSSPNAGAAG